MESQNKATAVRLSAATGLLLSEKMAAVQTDRFSAGYACTHTVSIDTGMIWSMFLGLVAMAAFAAPAAATTLSPASFLTSVTMPGTHYTISSPAPIILADDVQNPGSQSVFSLVQTGGTVPMIDLSADANVTSVSGNPELRSASVDVSSNLVYSMSVDGPANSFIPLLVTTRIDISGSAETDPNASWVQAYGSVTIFGVTNWNASSYWNNACPIGTNCTQDAGTTLIDQQLLYFSTNTEYLVSMVADTNISARITTTGGLLSAHTDAQVIVDPLFEFFDPNDAALYTINFSANLATVPVPAAAWLFGSGLLGLLAVARRKKTA